ncbi:MAG: MATE family efflux transporter, partial [Alistipes inops]|nr:MATE family efflux transporter [Alistipes inops]
MKQKTIEWGTEKISVLFGQVFFPTLLGMLGVSAVTTIDGIFIGHGVGSNGIAAVNICVPLLMVLT